MRAVIKVNRLPDAPKPTKAVRIDKPERPFAETLEDRKMLSAKHNAEVAKQRKPKPSKPKKVYNPWTEDDIKTMLEMREQGASQRAIAEKLGKARSNVSYKLAEYLQGKKRESKPRRKKDEQGDPNRKAD